MAESDDESLVAFAECSICLDPFDDEQQSHKPKVGTCAHTVCEGCVTRWKNDCPMCRTAKAFTRANYNYALIGQISKQKKKAAAINQLLEDNKKKNEKILKLEADVEQSKKNEKKFEGFTCSKCSFPMMEDAAFVCTTCIPTKLRMALKADDFEFDCDFEDMCKLVKELLCGGCVLKSHKSHDTRALHSIQIEKSVGKLTDQMTRAFSKPDNWIGIVCGKTALTGEIRDKYNLLKLCTQGTAQALASSSSLNDFNRKKSHLNAIVASVASATDLVVKNLYHLKQCLEDGINATETLASDAQQSTPRCSRANKSLSPPQPIITISDNGADVIPSSSSACSSPRYIPVTPPTVVLGDDYDDESALLEGDVPSPSWPAVSCTSPPVVLPGARSTPSPPTSSSAPPTKRRRTGDDTPRRTFKFLNVDAKMVEAMTKVIESNLGGRVVPAGDFDPRHVTHVICSKMTPSASLYCLMAKGCWFLKQEYIDDCAEVGQLLQEELYEWGNPNNTDTAILSADELLLVGAAQRWRNNLSSNGWNTEGAFAGWRVLLYSTTEKCKTHQPILAAGGAFVINRRFYGGTVTDFKPTHVFVESEAEMDKAELDEVVKAGGKMLIPEFIWSYLQDENIIVDHFFHKDYKNLQTSG